MMIPLEEYRKRVKEFYEIPEYRLVVSQLYRKIRTFILLNKLRLMDKYEVERDFYEFMYNQSHRVNNNYLYSAGQEEDDLFKLKYFDDILTIHHMIQDYDKGTKLYRYGDIYFIEEFMKSVSSAYDAIHESVRLQDDDLDYDDYSDF